MFDNTLLDSMPSRQPVLRGKHWGVALGAGALVFALSLFALKMAFALREIRVLLGLSGVLGTDAFWVTLMLCYVYGDAKRAGLRVWFWLGLTVLLNLAGFLIYLVRAAARTGDWRRATVPAAYCFEVILVGALALAPLIYTEALPKVLPWVSVPSPPPALGTIRPAPPTRTVRQTTAIDLMKAPIVIPKTITQFREETGPAPQGPPNSVLGVIPGGTWWGSPNGFPGGLGLAGPPPAPPPVPKAKATRIQVGGQVEAAKLIFQPKPEYPPLARMARIQGTVRLEAVISRDGTIQDLRVLSGHPLLVRAASEGVARWRYQPTLLNGEPVEVVTEIDVNFTLAE